MADDRRGRRRRQRRRKIIVAGVAAAVVIAGTATAWAVSGSGGVRYRLADVTRSDVEQYIDADGTLTSQDTATQSFAASGTVQSVRVSAGEHVAAGQTLATLDRTSLTDDVTAAQNTLASAKQTLTDDETAQSSGTSSSSTTTSGSSSASGSSTTSGVTTDSAVTHTDSDRVVLVAAVTTAPSALSKAEAEVTAAQRDVVAAQSALDADVAALSSACTTSGSSETTDHLVAGTGGTVSGTAAGASVVTIADATTTSTNPQTVEANGSWTFAGLTYGTSYRVVVVPVVDSTACTAAIGAVSTVKGTSTDTSGGTLYGAITELDNAVAHLEKAASTTGGSTGGVSSGGSTGKGSTGKGSTGKGSTGKGSTGKGSTGTGSTSGGTSSGSSGKTRTGTTSGSSSTSSSGSSSSGTTITAAQIAADQQTIDAAAAKLAVARNDVGLATLTTPIAGTVASVGITAGSSVSASSTSDTIVITTDEALSVPVDISLTDIDLIKVGEHASVLVDGRSEPLDAKVSMIGLANVSSSSGSSSEYAVTLVLDKAYAKLFDGMGAQASIDVGTAKNAITVPLSAVHTRGTRSTVTVYSGGTATSTPVTLGVEGASVVQVTGGVTPGERVVLADLDEALPSSDSNSTSNRFSFTGRTRGGSGGFGGGGGGTRP